MTTKKKHIYFAALMFVVLVQRVLSPNKNKRIIYTDLAEAVGYPEEFYGDDVFNVSINDTMVQMSKLLKECEAGRSEPLPLIQGLAINKTTKMPGANFWWNKMRGKGIEAKKAFLQEEEAKIVEFGVKWEELAVQFHMKALKKLCAD